MFDDGDRRYLARTYSASDAARDSNSQATISYWIKFVSSGANQDILTTSNSGQTDRLRHYINDQSGQENIYMTLDGPSTNRNFLLPISRLSEQEWTNIVYNIDVDNSTGADKIKCWVNGVQQTSTDGSGAASPGATSYQSASSSDYFLFANEEHFIGNLAPASAGYTGFCLNSYLAEMHVLDGLLKAPSDFGQVDTSTNRWVPKDYKTNVGAYGARGFYMAFDNATGTGNGVGTDSSGNGFHFTDSNVGGGSAWATTDTVTDTPSKNYAVYDTVKGAIYTAMSMSEGNLTTKTGNGSVALAQGFPIQDGYWYYEVNPVEDVNNMVFGLYNPATTVTASTSNPSFSGIQVNGATVIMQNNGASNSVAGPTLSNASAGDVIGIYIRKVDNSYGMWFSLNGTAMSNTPAATATATADISFAASIELVPAVHYSNAGTKEAKTNFGQLLQFDGGATSFNAASDGYWKHAPVAGFKALNQDNLDDTASKLTAWAWIKNRDADDSHILVDRVRGVGEVLHSNATDLEATEPNTVQRFFQRGVQVGNDVQVNTVNESYVLWQWLVGEAATTTTINASSTTPTNSIASTVAAADAGHFSVVGYQGNSTNGATVAHSLGGEPELIFFRGREGSGASSFLWRVFSTAGGAGKYLRLNDSTALQDDTAYLNNTLPGSVVFTLGTDGDVNNSSYTYVAYCFRSVPGVCKVGKYIGNGDNAGTYIHTGFRVAMIAFKRVDGGSEPWTVFDNKRATFNPTSAHSYSQVYWDMTSGASSGSTHTIDFLSNGVKLRGNGGANNTNGGIYAYCAWGDVSFKYSNTF